MARQGGYSRSTNDEWVKVGRQLYGEAIRSAEAMGQDLTVWVNDAIAHHAYRCELMECEERYRADELTAQAALGPTPIRSDPQYQPSRAKPTITRTPPPGQGGPGRGRSYRR